MNSLAQTFIILYLYFKFGDLLPVRSAASNTGHIVVCSALFFIGALYIVAHALYENVTNHDLFPLEDYHYFGLRVVDFALSVSMLNVVAKL